MVSSGCVLEAHKHPARQLVGIALQMHVEMVSCVHLRISRFIFNTMSLFNSFIHGDKLTEFLIEGHNPDARLKLSTGDVDAFRQRMQTGEALRAYVAGRVVMSGPGVWVVTEQQVLIRDVTQKSVTSVGSQQIQSFEAIRGRYGHTVRLHAQGRQYSMYGVDAELALGFHQALLSLGVESAFDDKPPRSHTWVAYAGSLPSALDCLTDARQRLH